MLNQEHHKIPGPIADSKNGNNVIILCHRKLDIFIKDISPQHLISESDDRCKKIIIKTFDGIENVI